MATVAQIKVRQGNLSDLPILVAGEFGYATDVQRLYIGNTPLTQTANGSDTIFTFSQIDTDTDNTTDNNATLDFGNKMTYAVYIDDAGTETLQTQTTNYTSQDSSITFTTAPTAGQIVKVYYNTEVITSSPVSGRVSDVVNRTLAASASATNAGIAVDGNLYDYVDVEYILKNANGRRKGTISVSIDATGNTSTLNDSFTTSVVPTSTSLDNSFTGVVAGGTFNLQYTATNSADISYVLTNWKSS